MSRAAHHPLSPKYDEGMERPRSKKCGSRCGREQNTTESQATLFKRRALVSCTAVPLIPPAPASAGDVGGSPAECAPRTSARPRAGAEGAWACRVLALPGLRPLINSAAEVVCGQGKGHPRSPGASRSRLSTQSPSKSLLSNFGALLTLGWFLSFHHSYMHSVPDAVHLDPSA